MFRKTAFKLWMAIRLQINQLFFWTRIRIHNFYCSLVLVIFYDFSFSSFYNIQNRIVTVAFHAYFRLGEAK